jgi:hypothetical protein
LWESKEGIKKAYVFQISPLILINYLATISMFYWEMLYITLNICKIQKVSGQV